MKTKEEVKTKLFETLGTASMCWSETPQGIFDSDLCTRIGEELWNDVEEYATQSSDAVGVLTMIGEIDADLEMIQDVSSETLGIDSVRKKLEELQSIFLKEKGGVK